MSAPVSALVRAEAGPSLALVKYFGKLDDARNLPATPSLGITVSGLGSVAEVTASPGHGPDALDVDGRAASEATLERAVRVFDALRARLDAPLVFRACVRHHLPAAAGLASSSSGFAALTRAAAGVAGLDLSLPELAAIARLGSGSAARACFPGWAALETDGRAFPVRAEVAVALVAVIVEPGPKTVPSALAMARVRATSPLYAAWQELGRVHFEAALQALADRDLAHLFAVAEANSRQMHEALAAAVPAIDYATDRTRAALAALEGQRRAWPFPVAVSRDAGANPFVAVEARHADTVAAAVRRDLPAAEVRTLGPSPAPLR